MDVLRLDPVTYLPNSLVEGYNSMIWTERYLDNGEFEMKTPNVASTMILIPEGTPISLRDSKEVMFVETHSIGVDSDGGRELTVAGRTFETFLENRAQIATVYNTSWLATKQYKTSEMVSLLAWTHLVNTNGQDVTRPGTVSSTLSAVPGVVITDSSTLVDVAKDWWLETGQIYPTFRDFLGLGGLGVRNIRPSGVTGNVMTFDTTVAPARGTVLKVSTPNIQLLSVDIYNGVDRRRTQAIVEPVIFHYDSGHIDSPKYVFSSKDLKTMATITSSVGNQDVWLGTGITPPAINPGGLGRRVLYIDGGSAGGQTYSVFLSSLVQNAQIELMKNIRQVLFDGAISPISPYKYGTHYSLGDKVTLLAEYGIEQQMLVSEYVRTEDQAGDRGYPTLVLTS
jgi:hypothetical protein